VRNNKKINWHAKAQRRKERKRNFAPSRLILAEIFAFYTQAVNYPIAIFFTELETQCQWTFAHNNKVIIIMSNEEFRPPSRACVSLVA